MAPIPFWSGNLRLSLVLVPVKMYPATSDEDRVAFRMIQRESGTPIKYQKGVESEHGFKEVSEDQIIKGYELGERLRAGGFGTVYKANQATVGHVVAKICRN